jgi:glycosyltransferase involved in cell wall biosynthesis
VGRHPTGIDRVCLAYLQNFGKEAQAVVQHARFRRILDRKASADLFELLSLPPTGIRLALARNILRSAGRRKLGGHDRLYLNIGHTGLDDPGFVDWVRNASVRPIYFVHDLIPITHPQFCRAGEQDRHISRMRTVLATGAGTIGNSQATLDDLSSFARHHELPNPPAVAAWLGITELTATESRATPSNRPTFVVLGTIEARKNHLMLLQVWKRLIERLGSEAPRLLIIGQRGWECDEVFDLLDRNELLRRAVIETGDCTDSELGKNLASARALLFPSLVEGYGLPLVEALHSGTPVIASDLPVFREIGKGIPEFLDPLNATAWEQAILDYTHGSSEARYEQIRRLAGYRAPTWDDHFYKVEAWMAQL